jgi:hypothetical protein
MEIRWPSRKQRERLWRRARRSRYARVLWILGGIQEIACFLIWVLDQKSRLEGAMLTLEQLGEIVPTLYGVVISPWSGIVLILLGMLYVIFVPDEDHPAVKYPVLGAWVGNVLVWLGVVACAVLLGGALVVGYVAVHMDIDGQEWPPLRQEQIVQWAETLSPYRATHLGIIAADSRSEKFRNSLFEVFGRAQWSLPPGVIMFRSGSPVGVLIVARPDDPVALALQKLFSELEYSPLVELDTTETTRPSGSVNIRIGLKPRP